MTTNNMTLTPAIMAEDFITKNPHIQGILKNIDGTDMASYANWDNGCWKKITNAEMRSIICQYVKQAQKSGVKGTYNSLHSNTMSQLIDSLPKTEEADWDVSLNSIPLATEGRSLDYKGNIIDTPQSDLMLIRIPVHEADIPSPQDFAQSQTYKLLHDWLHQDQIDFLQIALGQALIGNPLHLILMFIGRGRNGKSLFLKFLYETFGDLAKTIAPDEFTLNGNKSQHSTVLMPLRTTRFITLGELESANTRLAGGKLKSLTGGDKFQARGMRQDTIDFQAIGIPIIFGNHDPKLTDMSVGIRQRLKYIAFENEFTDDQIIPEPTINKIIQQEKGHFLYWIIEGLRKYHSHNMQCPKFNKVELHTEKYLELENSMAEVVNMFLVESSCDTASIEIRDLLKHMEAHKLRLPGISLTVRGIHKELEAQKYKIVADNKGPVRLMGYNFKTEYQAPDSPEDRKRMADVAYKFRDGGY